MGKIPPVFFVFEMANNHMGDVAHGIHVIDKFASVCKKFPEFNFAFKLQYRDLDTFVHPSMQGRDDVKYIKRFSETRLSAAEFDTLIKKINEAGFYAMATPFDNASVGTIVSQKLDVLKIASCSFTDWPLLEEIGATDMPIIASTAGASLEEIDRVVSFLSHRSKDFAILHCVGEYPTADAKMHVGQIDFLRGRYPDVRIGFSTHENPANTDIIKVAISKGATIFEKHVGVPTEKYSLNAYSASPEQVESWLESARYALTICGVGHERLPENIAEKQGLRTLRRGVFARRDLTPGVVISSDDVYFAFPPEDDQYTANDWSKYASHTTSSVILKDQPIGPNNVKRKDSRDVIEAIAQKVKGLLGEAGLVIPGGVDLEISHHYGLDSFYDFGLTMITVVNRGYCKKLLISLPNQVHPEQYHKEKEETFHILHGEVELTLNDQPKVCRPGEVIHIEPGVRHSFKSSTGAIIEEISSTHYLNDSFYTDSSISNNPARKTFVTYWMS
jgi:sialic acid synthase SpsE